MSKIFQYFNIVCSSAFVVTTRKIFKKSTFNQLNNITGKIKAHFHSGRTSSVLIYTLYNKNRISNSKIKSFTYVQTFGWQVL